MTFAGKLCRASRYGWMLVGVSCLCATASCERLTREEVKVVGTWEFTGLDATVRLVFRHDHIVVTLLSQPDGSKEKWAPAAWGTWNLDGNDIVTDEEVFPISGYLSSHRQVARVPIQSFEEDRLVRADGGSDFYRVHVRAQEYSRLLMFLYVSASLIAFLTAIYGIRKSAFRKEFAFLTVGAAFAVGWSVSTLIAELAGLGVVILSGYRLRSLILPTEVARVVSLLLFTIGFVMLAFAVRGKTTAFSSPGK